MSVAKKFHELAIGEVEGAINQLGGEGLFFEEKISLAEADVLRCRFQGKRINFKVDFAYGAEIDPVDSFSSKEMNEISNLILTGAQAGATNCTKYGGSMIGLEFKRLGLSRDDVEALTRAGIRLKEKVAKTWIVMHETPDPEESEIVNFEAMVGRLPQDFRNFLKNHNGGIPNPSLLKTKNNKRIVEAFLAVKAPKGFSESIIHAVEVYRGRIPRATIPIASVGGGNLLLLILDSDRFGEILCWDHNLESNEEDAGDYFENTELVASSFSNLLERLASDSG